mgnify:CR=1 FL=1
MSCFNQSDIGTGKPSFGLSKTISGIIPTPSIHSPLGVSHFAKVYLAESPIICCTFPFPNVLFPTNVAP